VRRGAQETVTPAVAARTVRPWSTWLKLAQWAPACAGALREALLLSPGLLRTYRTLSRAAAPPREVGQNLPRARAADAKSKSRVRPHVLDGLPQLPTHRVPSAKKSPGPPAAEPRPPQGCAYGRSIRGKGGGRSSAGGGGKRRGRQQAGSEPERAAGDRRERSRSVRGVRGLAIQRSRLGGER
jgi:hypothetical protein